MNSRIHFDGEWPELEMLTVIEAIWRSEALIDDAPKPTAGKTWVCIREPIDDRRTYYIASRFGYHVTLKALTALALAEQIEDFAAAAVPYADPQ